jgi:outer membrane protein
VRIRNSIAALLAIPAGLAWAQAPKVLTLQDCIRLAESVPSPVSIARQETEIARRGLTQARAGFLPLAQLSNGYTYNSPLLDNRSQFSFIALNGIREYGSALTAIQELDTSGRLRAELARAHADRDAANSTLALTQRDLKRSVTEGYYRLLLARHIVDVTRSVLDESESFEKRTRLLFQNGEAAQADVVKASAQVASLRQQLSAAELDARLANQELAAFWTQQVDDPLNIEDVLAQPPPPPEAPQAGSPFLRRIEFNLLDAQRRGFEADARRARAALLPQLNLVFQYGIDAQAVRIRERGYAAFLNLNIPIFDWLKARSTTEQFRLRAQQVQDNHAIAERTFSRDYRNALARVKELFGRIGLAEAQVKLSEQDLRLSRLRYEGGEGSALDVVTAQNQSAQARTNYYAAIAGYLSARADLEVAAGR